MKNFGIDLVERGRIPDAIVRRAIRHLLRRRLEREDAGGLEAKREAKRRLIRELRDSPIALATDKANEQHYEIPPVYFETVLGPRLKYSGALWPDDVHDLAAAEEAMLDLTARRAGIEDGMTVLELGCGWGSLSTWIAERFPHCRVLGVSNSRSQREAVMARAGAAGLDNLTVETADMNDFDTDRRFDRVVSVEMFEHMRNYERLMRRIAGWLEPDGKLFVHIFTHREFAYPFEVEGPLDWMARYFFTGGLMPSDDLLLYFQDDLAIEDHWRVNGRHYQRTLDAWLARHDARRDRVMEIMEDVYGTQDAERWFHRWRVFYMACSELFGFRGGEEWLVSHYRFRRRG